VRNDREDSADEAIALDDPVRRGRERESDARERGQCPDERGQRLVRLRYLVQPRFDRVQRLLADGVQETCVPAGVVPWLISQSLLRLVENHGDDEPKEKRHQSGQHDEVPGERDRSRYARARKAVHSRSKRRSERVGEEQEEHHDPALPHGECGREDSQCDDASDECQECCVWE
jgi:hypothetical protein